MNKCRRLPIWLGLLLICLAVGACGPDEEVLAAEARAEAWTQIQKTHEALVEKRKELAAVEAQVAAGVEGLVVEAGADAKAAYEELQGRAAELANEATNQADAFGSELVGFINENPMIRGETPNEEQLAAIRLKSGEDLILAMDWVNKGGDWKRAGDILERALQVDPDNEELQTKLAWVEEMRFVNAERFALLKKGMTQDEVIELVGPVNLRNVKEFPGSRLGWFYRKDPDTEGGAAGVYFEKKGGKWLIYDLDYEAIKSGDDDE